MLTLSGGNAFTNVYPRHRCSQPPRSALCRTQQENQALNHRLSTSCKTSVDVKPRKRPTSTPQMADLKPNTSRHEHTNLFQGLQSARPNTKHKPGGLPHLLQALLTRAVPGTTGRSGRRSLEQSAPHAFQHACFACRIRLSIPR